MFDDEVCSKVSLHVFPNFDEVQSSPRVRMYNFEPFLRGDFKVFYYPLFKKETYKAVKKKSKIIWFIYFAFCYSKRFIFLSKLSLFNNKRDNVVFLKNEFFPKIPFFIESIFYSLNRVVVDYDDAVFYNYDNSCNNKIYSIMRISDKVIVGNDYLKSVACLHNNEVYILPSLIDLDKYRAKGKCNFSPLTIGWIGAASTAENLYQLEYILLNLYNRYNIKIKVVGPRNPFQKNSVLNSISKVVEWDENTEVKELQSFDIGIMPLDDKPFNYGKCAFKLIQYMALGLPVVATPIGMNDDLVVDNENGFKATTNEEWYSALERLILSTELRQRLGENGRSLIVSKYTYQSR